MAQKLTYEEVPMHGSVFIERRFNADRVPTIEQVNEFFSLMKYGTRWHAFFTVCFYCGLRPCEIVRLTTDMVITDGNHWTGLVYPIGKPKPSGKKGIKSIRKWNRIDERLGHIPPGALESLRTYWQTHSQTFGLLFPKTYDQYGKAFSKIRATMIARGNLNWETTSEDYFRNLKNLKGQTRKTEYDITPYSGRRFFVSAYYWLVSAQNRNGVPDIVETQKRMVHTQGKDTQTYVHSWRALGLQDEQIGRGWNILTGQNPKQQRLNDWY